MTDTASNSNGHSDAYDDTTDPFSPVTRILEDLVAKGPDEVKKLVEPFVDAFGSLPPFALQGFAAALSAHATARAERHRQEPITDAQNSWEVFVNEQFDKSEHDDFFVASVALKGIGDIGFGPVRRLPCGLLALGVVGNGPDKKPAKMDRHFSTADIAMMGIVEVLVEPPKPPKSNLVV